MKTHRRFKDSWFYTALIVAIVVGEAAAWILADTLGWRHNPVLAVFVSAGIVAAITMVLYEGEDLG